MKIITNTRFYLENSKWINGHRFDESGKIYRLDGSRIKGYPIGNYLYVGITGNDRKLRSYAIHRVFAILFLQNFNEANVVTHKNGNKLDNSIKNLEWVSKSAAAELHKNGDDAKKSSKIVIAINENTGEEREFCSMMECGEYYGISPKSISRRIKQNSLTKDGIKFKYKFSNYIMTSKEFEDLLSCGELKEHPKYEKYYGWLSAGKIISTCRGSPKILKAFTSNNGYSTLCIRYNNAPVSIQLHRFLYECSSGILLNSFMEVDHIDGNSRNNSIVNLQILSKQENIRKSSNKSVSVIFKNKSHLDFESLLSCAKFLKISTVTLRSWRKQISSTMFKRGIEKIIVK